MGLFKKAMEPAPLPYFSPEEYEPVVRCSICTGEQVACMRDRSTGKVHELMFLRTEADMEEFCRNYKVKAEDVRKIY